MTADLLVRNAQLVATCDADRREIAGGWIAVTGGLISAVGGPADPLPAAARVLDADGCLITPGLINTHHHIYQNLTRSYRPVVNGTLFEWLTGLYPLWSGLDEEASYLAAWVGLAELAMGGCTTTTDHLYVAPAGGGDLWTAEIRAARELGMRFHPTRGAMSVSRKDGGLPPDSVVQDEDEILADCERLVAAHHDPSWGAMVRVAIAPCSPFSVSPALMRSAAELAERLDVRLHTHLAEDPDEDTYCLEKFGRRPIEQFEEVGWLTGRSWVAHCIYPSPGEIARLGAAGVGVAHCPSSNMLIGGRGLRTRARVPGRRGAGRPRLRRLGVHRLGVDVARGADGAAARPPAPGTDWDDGTRGAGHGDPRRRRVPGPDRRAGRTDGGRGGRPGLLVTGGCRVRRCADRPGRGVAALRPGDRSPHGGGRPPGRRVGRPGRDRHRGDPDPPRRGRPAHPGCRMT